MDTLVTIYIDGTYCNNLPIIGPGSFYLPQQVLFQGLSIAIPYYSVLSLQSETYFMGITELSLRNLSMIFNNTIASTINISQSFNIWLYDANIINSGTVPGISYSNASISTITMYGNSSIQSNNVKSNTPMLYFDTSTCTIYAYDMGQITQYAINYHGSHIIIYTNSSANIDNSYNAIIILQSLATRCIL